jgi:retron-type reverse transcriptase
MPIKRWLKAGYMDKNVFQETDRSTLQACIVRPLLVNITLDVIEEELGVQYSSRKATESFQTDIQEIIRNLIPSAPKENFLGLNPLL